MFKGSWRLQVEVSCASNCAASPISGHDRILSHPLCTVRLCLKPSHTSAHPSREHHPARQATKQAEQPNRRGLHVGVVAWPPFPEPWRRRKSANLSLGHCPIKHAPHVQRSVFFEAPSLRMHVAPGTQEAQPDLVGADLSEETTLTAPFGSESSAPVSRKSRGNPPRSFAPPLLRRPLHKPRVSHGFGQKGSGFGPNRRELPLAWLWKAATAQ